MRVPFKTSPFAAAAPRQLARICNQPGMLLMFLTVLALMPTLAGARWGSDTHEYINHYAAEYLPPQMSFMLDQQIILRQHASDPDRDGLPGYYHYIDIDHYLEFYQGTLPHEWEAILELYPKSEVESVGIVPWVIQWWTDSLSVLMSQHEWESAWQVAAELGHYVADSHQPLHLTQNYDGQYTGNDGIHSRYETRLINLYRSQLPLPTGEAIYWDSVIDSVFAYIDTIYPNVALILEADNLARDQDPSYGLTYSSAMWTELGSITTGIIQSAILDLASIWYTAWINAGGPVPGLGIDADQESNLMPFTFSLYQNDPNPFNPITTIRYSTPSSSNVVLRIFDMMGREVSTLVNETRPPGSYTISWDGRDADGLPVGAGVYFYQMRVGAHSETRKMLLLK